MIGASAMNRLNRARIWFPLFRIGRFSVGIALKPRLRLTMGMGLR